MARRRNRDPFLWGVLCFIFGLIGILALAVVGDARGAAGRGHSGRNSHETDWVRWQALIDVDPDIRAAASRVRAFGQHYEEQLAEKYLALNDKAYLPALVSKTLERAGYSEPPEPAAGAAPPPRLERPAPPISPRPAPERTQAISPRPPPRPAPAPRSSMPDHAERPLRAAPPAPAQKPAEAVERKIRNSVYRQNSDGTCVIVQGRYAGRTFGSFEEMRRVLR